MSSGIDTETSVSLSFEEQLSKELAAVNKGRSQTGNTTETVANKDCDAADASENDAFRDAHAMSLCGLALSGGGIRSATFNLGIIQCLARFKLLHRIDYLSTVSGGGYIGSWLSAWVHRAKSDDMVSGVLRVERELGQQTSEGPELAEEPDLVEEPEPKEMRWLRRYSNYLTPRVGPLSIDTLTGVSTYLRNLLLNQATLVMIAFALLILPWFFVALRPLTENSETAVAWYSVISMLVGSLCAGYETFLAGLGASEDGASSGEDPTEPHHLRYWVLFGCFVLAALLFGAVMLFSERAPIWMAIAFAFSYLLGNVAGWIAARISKGEKPITVFQFFWAFLAAALLAGQLVLWIHVTAVPAGESESSMFAVVFGPLAVIAAILLTLTFHVGLSSRGLREAARELWSRHGAHQLRFGLGWLFVTSLGLFGPLAIILANKWILAMGGATWVITTAAGVVAGSGASTGGRGSSKTAELVARVAPYVFVLGLLLALSYGLYRIMWWQWSNDIAPPGNVVCEEIVDGLKRPIYGLDKEPSDAGAEELIYSAGIRIECLPKYTKVSASLVRDREALLSLVFLVLLVAIAFLSWRIDINVFGFHMFYRNRIQRCYMGASNQNRQAHPYTDLDPTDSPRLSDLTLADEPTPLGQRPFPIINAALNITSPPDLASQERKAASFTFTPMFCGYEVREPNNGKIHAYQPTEDYVKGWGWLSLGLPIAISGAAASPNSGYHTNPATAFLMTVFNVRLGWWMQNPRDPEVWKTPGPRLALFPLLRELAGLTSYESRYVYLSDGGHFENLGVYELVRRRCRYVIACDAGCDPDFQFDDLGNAIRKCKIDLGIDIDIDPRAIRSEQDSRQSIFHCAVGRIRYPDGPPGFLLYVKASLTGDEPADVLQYASQNPKYPHQSTADQWFSESQFESYRQLGFHILDEVLESSVDQDLEDTFNALRERWYRSSPKVAASFGKYGQALEGIFELIRKEKDLEFMDEQIYPELPYLKKAGGPIPEPSMLPSRPEEIRAGFYLCNSLIQIMENVYQDLNLEEQYDHPDNRGWMNLLRHWSWAGMLRVTWAISASTYGARFQRFCRRRLDLSVGEVVACIPNRTLEEAGIEMNFLETRFCEQIGRECPDSRAPGRKLQVMQLLLSVANPFANKKEFKFSFPFALALLDIRPGKRHLVYYRVRDHLRGIGLGRKGLAVLKKDRNVCYPPDDSHAAQLQSWIRKEFRKKQWTAEADLEALENLWTSVAKAEELDRTL